MKSIVPSFSGGMNSEPSLWKDDRDRMTTAAAMSVKARSARQK